MTSSACSNKNVIVVVEPHADDAYLSLHQHLVDWKRAGKTVYIVTVFSGTRKRARDGQAYADAVGVNWVGLGFDEFAEEDKRNAYLNTPFDPLVGSLSLLHSVEDVQVIGPLGIQNPDHKAVSEWLKPLAAHLYTEIPYYTKLKNEEEVNGLMAGKTVVSIKKPKHYKGDDKYWKCFKDQAKFFHFNPPESYKDVPEILLK